MGLSIITSGLAFVGSANAIDLIVNGSFESPPDVGWTGYFKTYNFSDVYFTGPVIPESEKAGNRYSWRHGVAEGEYNGPCTQTVDLTIGASGADIDAGKAQYAFSTWLASYGRPEQNPDQPYLTLQFLDTASTQIGDLVVIDRVMEDGFVTFADGVTTFDGDVHLHDWAKYLKAGTIPASARKAVVAITHSPNAGLSGTPDTYTDLVKLDVTGSSAPSIGLPTALLNGFTLDLADNVTQVDTSTLVIKLDGTVIRPTAVDKVDQTTTVKYTLPAGTFFASGSTHSIEVTLKDNLGTTVTGSRSFSVQVYTTIPATAKVTPDTSKPGFIWRVHHNNALQSNDNERPEQQLAGKLIDPASGLPYDNTADPQYQGPALDVAQPADPTWAPLTFEIETVINMSQVADTSFGNFKPDTGMPGIPGAVDGIAGEVVTYLDLPAGMITMGVNSDDGFRTKSGEPLDAFRSIQLGEYNGGRGAGDTIFTFVVPEAGVYPFRTVWEEGGGDANLEWFTVKDDGTKVLINDLENGGVPAYRATTTPSKPYVRTLTPAPAPRQLDAVSSVIVIELVDGATETVDDASISFKMDGKTLTGTKDRQNNVVSMTFAVDGLQIPADFHQGELSFKGNAGTVRSESYGFRNLKNIVLPAPKILENFDSYPEDSQPEGWTAWNFTAHNSDGRDITQQKSESYEDWVLVDVSHISSIDGGSPYTITPGQFVEIGGNRVELRNANPPEGEWPEWLMSGNVLYAESDSRTDADSRGGPNVGQAQFIITKPFDMSSFSEVVMTFSSIYQQNQDSLGAVEYSVDGGAHWLPVMYFLEEPDIKLKADGTVDALRTFNDANTDTANWVENEVPKGDKYGDGLGAPITEALGDYVVPRINDGDIEGKRMEIARLAQAAGKKDVRIRFAQLGTDSWYFAIDNLAFYDIGTPTAAPTVSIAKNGADVVITFEGTLQEATSVNGPFAPVAGNSPLTVPASTGVKFYRAVR